MRKPNYQKIEMYAENDIYECKSLEEEIFEAETKKTPIETASPIIYTPRDEGVVAAYNPRTDRFELAMDAMSKVAGSIRAHRENASKSNAELLNTGTEGRTEISPIGEPQQ